MDLTRLDNKTQSVAYDRWAQAMLASQVMHLRKHAKKKCKKKAMLD